MSRVPLLALCLALVAPFGCGDGPASEEDEPRARAEPFGEYMRDHFEQVRGVQVAVIRGDMEAVKAAARWVASREAVQGMPQDWEPFVVQMRSAAEEAVAAPDIAAAAAATANMGLACAACHLAMHEFPQFLAVTPPPEADGTVPHMTGHMWAAGRMWKGLVTPSAESWNQGVAALDGDPLDAESIAPEFASIDEVEALEREVHGLAAQGRSVANLEARAQIYGQFLATCAECHGMLGISGQR